MASYMSDAALNLAADHVTNRTVQLRLHSAAAGNAGTTSRIGAVSADVAAGGWSAAAGGEVTTSGPVNFGILDAASAQTVRSVSAWDGATFLGWADVYQPGTTNVGVSVAAGRSFTLNAGTFKFRFRRPSG